MSSSPSPAPAAGCTRSGSCARCWPAATRSASCCPASAGTYSGRKPAWERAAICGTDWPGLYGDQVRKGTLTEYKIGDLAASIASGSVRTDGMVVIPCSMKTLSAIAHGTSSSLIERAADVTLKEARPLVLVPRETPLNVIHLRNLLAAAEAGARIVPAMPAFYQKPSSFDDLADFIAGRVLNLLGIEQSLFTPWDATSGGEPERSEEAESGGEPERSGEPESGEELER